MRELTFRGFLTQYVKHLSVQETTSLYKLAKEASSTNPRLKEPLFLYALFSQKKDGLLQATKTAPLHEEYHRLMTLYTAEQMTELLEQESPLIAVEYHKVWRSFKSRKNKWKADDHTKELMRQKVKYLQEKTGITNYRIYTDLQLNPGNLNAWLKHGFHDRVSLETARKTLQYVDALSRL